MDKVGESMKNIVKSGNRNTFVFSFVPKHTELKQFPNSELKGTNLTFYTGSNFGLGWVMGLVPLGKGYGKNIIFFFFWKIMIRDFITIHDFNESIIFTILSWFFFMLVLLFCKLFEHYSQTNFPIIKTKPFKVTTFKKGWWIFRCKWVKVKICHYFIFVIKKWEQIYTLQIHTIYK